MRKFEGEKKRMVILLAIIGMLCWGIAPIFAKIGLDQINPLSGLALRTIFTGFLVTGMMVFNGSISEVKSIPFNSWVLMGAEAIFATLIGDLAYFAAIKKGDVSLVTIIMSSSPLITIICAVIFLGEQITLLRVLGSFLIILGITLIV
jgi:bacterial/archaeal transporter family protein